MLHRRPEAACLSLRSGSMSHSCCSPSTRSASSVATSSARTSSSGVVRPTTAFLHVQATGQAQVVAAETSDQATGRARVADGEWWQIFFLEDYKELLEYGYF